VGGLLSSPAAVFDLVVLSRGPACGEPDRFCAL
jgi:hypothetical protein